VTLDLDTIQRIARRYVPEVAGDKILIDGTVPHGPAHEIGHLLVAARWRRRRRDFGLSTSEPTRAMLVEEAAASIIHTWIVAATPEWRAFMSLRKLQAIGYVNMEPGTFRRVIAARLLRDAVRENWNVVRCNGHDDIRRAKVLLVQHGVTRAACQNKRRLEALCRRALGRS